MVIACKELKSILALSSLRHSLWVLGSTTINMLRPINNKGPQANLAFCGEINVILQPAVKIDHRWDVLHSLLRNEEQASLLE